jgi:hypothetical protein
MARPPGMVTSHSALRVWSDSEKCVTELWHPVNETHHAQAIMLLSSGGGCHLMDKQPFLGRATNASSPFSPRTAESGPSDRTNGQLAAISLAEGTLLPQSHSEHGTRTEANGHCMASARDPFRTTLRPLPRLNHRLACCEPPRPSCADRSSRPGHAPGSSLEPPASYRVAAIGVAGARKSA